MDGLAGSSVLYSKRGGMLEKMAPVDKGELSRLTEQVEWETDEVPMSFHHDNLRGLGELDDALAAAGLSAVDHDHTVPPPPPLAPP